MLDNWTWMSAMMFVVPVCNFFMIVGAGRTRRRQFESPFTFRAGFGGAAIGWGVMCVMLTILEGGHPMSPPMTGDGLAAAGALVLMGAALCVGWRAWLAMLACVYAVGPCVVAALGYGGGYAQHVQDALLLAWLVIIGIMALGSAGGSAAGGEAAGGAVDSIVDPMIWKYL